MNTSLDKLEQIFYKKKLSEKELLSLFDKIGIPKDTCWRTIFKMIFHADSNIDRKLTKSQLEPIMEKSLKYARKGMFTEKTLRSLIKEYNAMSFSVCDNQLTGILNELDLLTNQFKSKSAERCEKIKELESETVTTVESDLSLEKKN